MLEKNLKITLTNFSVEKCTAKNRKDAPLGRAAPVKLEGNASAIFGSVLPDRKTTEQRLEPGCNGEGEKREKEKKVAQGNVGFVVFMICFLKNGAPKSCLKIQKVTQNGKLAHTLTHKNTRHRYVATTHTHLQAEKGKRERKRAQIGKGEGGGKGNTNDKYTHKQKKMWEKRLNENYFKLFRKKRERKQR